jgi:hypothetical protein
MNLGEKERALLSHLGAGAGGQKGLRINALTLLSKRAVRRYKNSWVGVVDGQVVAKGATQGDVESAIEIGGWTAVSLGYLDERGILCLM